MGKDDFDGLGGGSPTRTTYTALDRAFDHFNDRVFGGRLPACLVTLQRHKAAYGFFAGGRFGSRDGSIVTDEIALNPARFQERTIRESLSTLVHEMTHLEQQHFGQPSRSGYHNKEWGDLMDAVGLAPTDSGQPGGKRTGQQVTHMIVPDGPFDLACRDLLEDGWNLDIVELWTEDQERAKTKKAASKTKYACPMCEAAAWAKPGANLICGDCGQTMIGNDPRAAAGGEEPDRIEA